MALGKQAKVLNDAQVKRVLNHLTGTRYADRDRVMFLLSCKAGLRAKEIACLTWQMVTDAQGVIGDAIALQDVAAKGRSGRTVPLNADLAAALRVWQASPLRRAISPYVIPSERSNRLSAQSVASWFHRLYNDEAVALKGCSSHSGRRTFVTKAARKIVEAGGSLRDIQQMAGHASLATTQRYIEGDSDAKRRVVNMI
jgi:integrase/recombinase XerC